MSGYNRKKKIDGLGIARDILSGNHKLQIDQSLIDRFNRFRKRYETGEGATSDLRDFVDEQGYTTETSANAELLDLLQNGGDLNNIIAAWIMNMSKNGNFTDEIRDQLRQLLFQMVLTDDQRSYDWKMLQDSRLYNNPQNELSRLMGAGIGRDAALQILSGSAGNVGSGGSAAPTAPAVPQTSGSLDLARQQATVNTVAQTVSMLGQLVDSGLSIAQGVESVRGMHLQNSMNQQQLAAYNATNQLVQQIELLQKTGAIESADIEKLSNGNDLVKYLQGLAENNQDVASLLDSDAFKGTFGTLAGRDFFNSYWNSVRTARDSGTIADRYLEQLDLDNVLRSITVDKIGAEMSLIGAQQNEIDQRIIESTARVANINADIQVKNKQGEWISIQTKNYQRRVDAEIHALDAQAWLANNQGEFALSQNEGQKIQNNINSDIFELNHAGFPMMKDAYIIECQRELRKLRLENDEEGRKKQLQQWALQQDNAVKLAYFEQIYYNSAGDFITNHPTLYAIATGFNLCGASDIVKTGSTAVGAAKTALKLIK